MKQNWNLLKDCVYLSGVDEPTCTEVMGRLGCPALSSLPLRNGLNLELGCRPGSVVLPLSIVDSMPDFLDGCGEVSSGPHTCSPSFLSNPQRQLYFENFLTFNMIYFLHMGTHAIVYMWKSEDKFQE